MTSDGGRFSHRYYPLPVDSFDGSSIGGDGIEAEAWLAHVASFADDFGAHPLGASAATADVPFVLAHSAAHPPAPPTPEQDADNEFEWRRKGVVKLVAYRGAGIAAGGAGNANLRLTSGRTFVGGGSLESWVLSLEIAGYL